MICLEEHFSVSQHDDDSGDHDNDGFDAFGLRRHGDLLLHEVHKQVKKHACQNGPVADEVHPGDDESEWNSAE